MAIYEVEDPDTGMTLELEGDSPPTEQELNSIFSQYQGQSAQPKPQTAPAPSYEPVAQRSPAPMQPAAPQVNANEQQELADIDRDFSSGDALSSLLNSTVTDIKTTKKRDVVNSYGVTKEAPKPFSYAGDQSTLQYTEGPRHGMSVIGDAPELNEFSVSALKTSVGLLTEGKPDEVRKVIKSNIPNSEFRIDADGNHIAVLPSGEYVFDSPGIDALDVARTVVDVLAFTPAGRASTVGRAALASGATEAGLTAANIAAGGQVGEDELEDVLAATALGGAGKLAENAVSAVRRIAKGSGTPEDQALVDFAESQGVPLMTSDVAPPNTFIGKQARTAAERIPVTGTGVKRAEQQAERSQLVKDFTSKFGDYNPQEVTESLTRRTSKIKKAAGNARQKVVDQVEDAEVPTRNAIDAIDAEIDRLSFSSKALDEVKPLRERRGRFEEAIRRSTTDEQRSIAENEISRIDKVIDSKKKKTSDEQTIKALNNYKDDMLEDPSFGSIERLRTQFRTDVKGERALLNNRSEAAINRIYSAMGKDLNETVELSLGPVQARKWKNANSAYANEMNKIKNTRLKSVLQKGQLTPEVVNNLLFSNKPSEVSTLFRSLDAKGKDAARAGLIGKAVEKAGDSPQKFLGELNKLEKSLNITLRKEDREYVKGLKKYLTATGQAARAEVVTPTGQQLFQIAAPVSVVGDVSATGGVGTSLAALYGLMGRAYESKPVRTAVVKLNSQSPNTDDFIKRLESVSSVLSTLMQTVRRESEE